MWAGWIWGRSSSEGIDKLCSGERSAGDSNLLDDAPVDVEAFGQVELDGPEQRFGFVLAAAGHDILQGHAAGDREGALGDDGAFVQVHGYEVGRDTHDFDSAFPSLSVGLWAGKAGQ